MRYALEEIPNIEINNAWFFLSKPYIFIISLYCFFIYLAGLYGQFEDTKAILPAEQPNAIILYNSHSSLNVNHLANVFMVSLLVATSMYVAFYIKLLKELRNLSLYIQYWRSLKIGNVYPVPYLLMLSLSYSMIYLYVMDIHNTMRHFAYANKYMTIPTFNALHFLFGELSIITYFLLLPKFIPIHLEILRVINEGAEY